MLFSDNPSFGLDLDIKLTKIVKVSGTHFCSIQAVCCHTGSTNVANDICCLNYHQQ